LRGLFLWRKAVAKRLGNDYRLWIEQTAAGTYAEIKGNQDLSVSRSAATIDISSKDNFPYAARAAGMREVSISASFIPDLPDTTGFGRLETLAQSTVSSAFKIQIRKGGSAGATPADVVYEGSVYVTDFDTNFGQNAGVTASCTFVASAAPTTDVLA
jgi:predicted secreted protein